MFVKLITGLFLSEDGHLQIVVLLSVREDPPRRLLVLLPRPAYSGGAVSCHQVFFYLNGGCSKKKPHILLAFTSQSAVLEGTLVEIAGLTLLLKVLLIHGGSQHLRPHPHDPRLLLSLHLPAVRCFRVILLRRDLDCGGITRTWVFMWLLVMKVFSQCGHLNGRSPLCCRMCTCGIKRGEKRTLSG